MICGALQTLNEEAFEDVVASERPSPTGGPAGEMIANNNNAQSQLTSQQQQQSSAQQSQQPLTPIQETVEHERTALAFCTERRRSSTQNSIATNNLLMHTSHSNHSGLSLDDRQYSTLSLSTPSSLSLSQSQLLHSTPTILLTKSDEHLNANANANANPSTLTSSASTVILMPNLCDDKSSKYDRTHL